MVFSSITFLYYFLPIILLLYYIVPNKLKNFILFLGSFIFYFYGESKFSILLLFSCFINYIFALLIERFRNKILSKIILIFTIIINLGALCYFKYFNFFIENINSIFKSNIILLNIIMPIGISFFTFQTLSYVIDVYRNKVKANTNFINFSCYVCMFPQLIAGPIVRYSDINDELENRKVTFDDFGTGVERFIIGLGKKVLIANIIGEMITSFNNINNISVLAYIIIGLGYTLQLYFDFSGYSDMAIGLGRMFGFHFLENFNYPLIASSITDFWRRWHISLSSFFKDYIYIPLGGNRVNKIKHIRNIFIVWLLTGFWHGASWNFIIWGLYFGIILIIEKYFILKYLNKCKILNHIYSIFLVVISFIIFSCRDMNGVFVFLKNMLGFNNLPFINSETIYYLRSYIIVIALAIIGSTPLLKVIKNKMENNIIFNIVEIIGCLFILILSTAFIIDSSFNPFLYFRF